MLFGNRVANSEEALQSFADRRSRRMLTLISDAFVASELADTIVTDLVTSSELNHQISSTTSRIHGECAMKTIRKESFEVASGAHSK